MLAFLLLGCHGRQEGSHLEWGAHGLRQSHLYRDTPAKGLTYCQISFVQCMDTTRRHRDDGAGCERCYIKCETTEEQAWDMGAWVDGVFRPCTRNDDEWREWIEWQ